MGSEEQPDIANRPADELVTRGGAPGLTVTGFLADSDRPGHRRIYLDRALERFVDFAVDDVLEHNAIAADSAPFLGENATSILLRPDARVEIGRRVAADAFDLDPRLADPAGAPGADRFVFTLDPSDDCYSRAYRCTRTYCLALEGNELYWPLYRRP